LSPRPFAVRAGFSAVDGEDDSRPDNARDNTHYVYCVQSVHGSSQFGRFGRPGGIYTRPSRLRAAADLAAFLKDLGEEFEPIGSCSSVKATVPHSHGQIFTRKDERRREMQRVETSQVVGERDNIHPAQCANPSTDPTIWTPERCCRQEQGRALQGAGDSSALASTDADGHDADDSAGGDETAREVTEVALARSHRPGSEGADARQVSVGSTRR
jgi:hypothetical protein